MKSKANWDLTVIISEQTRKGASVCNNVIIIFGKTCLVHGNGYSVLICLPNPSTAGLLQRSSAIQKYACDLVLLIFPNKNLDAVPTVTYYRTNLTLVGHSWSSTAGWCNSEMNLGKFGS